MRTILRPSGDQYFLKDAIRDLVVVIVGILAALWLESAWQDRQDRAEEALLLEGLREEFVANKAQLVDKMAVWSGVIVAADRALPFMGKNAGEYDPTAVVDAFRGTDMMQFFDPRIGQLSSLISSGKLGLIDCGLMPRVHCSFTPACLRGGGSDLREKSPKSRRKYSNGEPSMPWQSGMRSFFCCSLA